MAAVFPQDFPNFPGEERQFSVSLDFKVLEDHLFADETVPAGESEELVAPTPLESINLFAAATAQESIR